MNLVLSAVIICCAAYISGEHDIVGSYPVYYVCVFSGLLLAAGLISAFVTMNLYYFTKKSFYTVWALVLPLSSGLILFGVLFAYSSL